MKMKIADADSVLTSPLLMICAILDERGVPWFQLSLLSAFPSCGLASPADLSRRPSSGPMRSTSRAGFWPWAATSASECGVSICSN